MIVAVVARDVTSRSRRVVRRFGVLIKYRQINPNSKSSRSVIFIAVEIALKNRSKRLMLLYDVACSVEGRCTLFILKAYICMRKRGSREIALSIMGYAIFIL